MTETMMHRLTADLTIKLDPQIETVLNDSVDLVGENRRRYTRHATDRRILVRALFIHAERKTIRSAWKIIKITCSAARPLASLRKDGWKKAYYETDNFVITPQMQEQIDDAMKMMVDDCRISA